MGVLDGKYIYNIDRVTNDVVVVKSTLSPTYSATMATTLRICRSMWRS